MSFGSGGAPPGWGGGGGPKPPGGYGPPGQPPGAGGGGYPPGGQHPPGGGQPGNPPGGYPQPGHSPGHPQHPGQSPGHPQHPGQSPGGYPQPGYPQHPGQSPGGYPQPGQGPGHPHPGQGPGGYPQPGQGPGGQPHPGQGPGGQPHPGQGPGHYSPPGPPPGGGYQPPPGGGYGPPPGSPPGGGGYGQPPGSPPGGGGYGQPPGSPPGGFGPPPGYPPGGGGYGPPGSPPGYGPPGGFNPPPSPPAGPPGSWSPTEAIGFAWNALTKDFAGVALPIAVAAFVMSLPGGFMYGVMTALPTMMASSDYDPLLVTYAVMPLFGLVALVAQSFFLGGLVRFGLSVARGQKPEFGDVFSGGRYFGSMLVGQFVFFVLYAIGAALCIVPGYIVALGCMFFAGLIVDKGLGGVDSLKESWRLTNGHKMNLFVLWLLLACVNLAGYLACCVGALLVSTPIAVLSLSFVYLRLNGEQPRLPG